MQRSIKSPTTKRFSWMLRMMPLFGIALCSMTLLSACETTITTDSVESEIKKGFEEKTNKVFKIDSIKCPEKIVAKKDKSYECSATASGADVKRDLTIEVKPTGEEAKFEWKITKGELPTVLETKSVEAKIKEGIEEQLSVKLDSVKCEDTIVATPDKTYECKATDQNGKSASVEVKPTEGTNFHWQLKKPE
jgi:hypothetical protein